MYNTAQVNLFLAKQGLDSSRIIVIQERLGRVSVLSGPLKGDFQSVDLEQVMGDANLARSFVEATKNDLEVREARVPKE